MRLSRAGLLIAIAISIPVIIELRTVAAFFGIEISVWATIAIGAAVIGALIAWSSFPGLKTPTAE